MFTWVCAGFKRGLVRGCTPNAGGRWLHQSANRKLVTWIDQSWRYHRRSRKADLTIPPSQWPALSWALDFEASLLALLAAQRGIAPHLLADDAVSGFEPRMMRLKNKTAQR